MTPLELSPTHRGRRMQVLVKIPSPMPLALKTPSRSRRESLLLQRQRGSSLPHSIIPTKSSSSASSSNHTFNSRRMNGMLNVQLEITQARVAPTSHPMTASIERSIIPPHRRYLAVGFQFIMFYSKKEAKHWVRFSSTHLFFRGIAIRSITTAPSS